MDWFADTAMLLVFVVPLLLFLLMILDGGDDE